MKNILHVRFFLVLISLVFGINGLKAQETYELSGDYRIDIPGVDHLKYTTVVYLEALDDMTFPEQDAAEIITQDSATFNPSFIVVSVGQTVNMPNNDEILHNVFSYTKGNQFDLGLYKSGESRAVTFKNPGLVRIFCSIHRSMKGQIFVAPTPLWSLVKDGQWSISNIPQGRYNLVGLSQGLPKVIQSIEVSDNASGIELTLKPQP